ncbi:cation:proton antiporter [Campylobacter lari]|uniref:cation:proton antiporter n=1 Tax=Campylobacter lari TaxID=201 RepID=UPI001272CCD8|nr:cation:proton antiporter [Campylobacter lari]EAI3897705.1 cation:proton antiporter [Campylobacter lari]EAJ5697328.1 cation:proton antiporter [Campylobacter lari]EAK9908214.1 cation:proton antiporter [Campylobacter lari]EAL3891371.1 cation:proton antiporter [Campylobacter lari]EDP6874817.1 cation:proton antiporter [Campylobacter lari]
MKIESLSPDNLTAIFLSLGILLLSAFVFGKIFTFLKAPKVIGEIIGGFVLGASGLYIVAPELITQIFLNFQEQGKILNTFYQLGLIFLMFIAGFNTQINFEKQNIKIISILFLGATFIPIVLGYFFIDYFKDSFIGEKGNDLSFSLVFLIAIAVTSIPVISKIFFDIGIIKTRFASIVLTTSTIQDLFLWILLNVAINTSTSNSFSIENNLWTAFITIILFIFVKILANIVSKIRFHFESIDFFTLSFVLLFLAIALLNIVHINPMYTSFLVGFLIKNTLQNSLELKERITSISDFSFSCFIPIYFALIGIQLNVIHEFSFIMFVMFCLLACVLEFFGSYISLLSLKISNISRVNFAITMNARGGPGIVLASVAFYYQIINTNFFTTLILTTLFSSMLAGYWLRYQKNKNDEVFYRF